MTTTAARASSPIAKRSTDLPKPVAKKAGWSDLDVRAVDTARLLAADAVQKAGNADPFRDVVKDGLTPTAAERKPVNDARSAMLQDLVSGRVKATA